MHAFGPQALEVGEGVLGVQSFPDFGPCLSVELELKFLAGCSWNGGHGAIATKTIIDYKIQSVPTELGALVTWLQR